MICTDRSSHIRPSVAVFFFSGFSALIMSSKVADWAGCDANRARTFCDPTGFESANCIDLVIWPTYGDVTSQVGLNHSESRVAEEICMHRRT